jgi:tetratricopeptide repeat protein/PEGA domain-containing protein
MIFAISLASAAHAQSAGRAENPEADKFVAEGIELRARGKDNEALKAFQKASEIDPDSVRVQIHLATVHQALGNWLLADEYLSMALARQNHPYVNRHRQTLEDAKKVIEGNIGRLELEGEPAGAEVRLNGRLVGTLPLSTPIRSTIGSYLLEVRREGFYAVQRPIVLTGGGLVREAIHLEPLPADGEGWRARNAVQPGAAPAVMRDGVEDSSGHAWLTWTLAGAAGLAGVTTVTALVLREGYAGRWNDNQRCLDADRTRAEVCGDERDKAQTAESFALVSGMLTGVFAAAATLDAFGVFEADAPPGEAGLRGCNLGFAGASCFGTF